MVSGIPLLREASFKGEERGKPGKDPIRSESRESGESLITQAT